MLDVALPRISIELRQVLDRFKLFNVPLEFLRMLLTLDQLSWAKLTWIKVERLPCSRCRNICLHTSFGSCWIHSVIGSRSDLPWLYLASINFLLLVCSHRLSDNSATVVVSRLNLLIILSVGYPVCCLGFGPPLATFKAVCQTWYHGVHSAVWDQQWMCATWLEKIIQVNDTGLDSLFKVCFCLISVLVFCDGWSRWMMFACITFCKGILKVCMEKPSEVRFQKLISVSDFYLFGLPKLFNPFRLLIPCWSDSCAYSKLRHIIRSMRIFHTCINCLSKTSFRIINNAWLVNCEVNYCTSIFLWL